MVLKIACCLYRLQMYQARGLRREPTNKHVLSIMLSALEDTSTHKILVLRLKEFKIKFKKQDRYKWKNKNKNPTMTEGLAWFNSRRGVILLWRPRQRGGPPEGCSGKAGFTGGRQAGGWQVRESRGREA